MDNGPCGPPGDRRPTRLSAGGETRPPARPGTKDMRRSRRARWARAVESSGGRSDGGRSGFRRKAGRCVVAREGDHRPGARTETAPWCRPAERQGRGAARHERRAAVHAARWSLAAESSGGRSDGHRSGFRLHDKDRSAGRRTPAAHVAPPKSKPKATPPRPRFAGSPCPARRSRSVGLWPWCARNGDSPP